MVPSQTPARISLPDRYRVVRHLANGGMASVWEAHDELLDRAVAVKLLAPHLSEDERARRRFQREARAAAGLSSHPHVVTIYDVGEFDGRVFMVMELMRCGSVADRLRAGEKIAHDRALAWLADAASALDVAHAAGIVHRDIKPANMLVDERDRLAIADFGIARLAWEDQLTATGQVLGTAAYISPEQAIGEPASAASDHYSLAVVAFELLTGTKPFRAEHFAAQARAHVEDPPPAASERAPDLPPRVDDVLERGLAKDPRERWPSAAAFVEALRAALAPRRATPIAGPPTAATPPTRRLAGPPAAPRPRRSAGPAAERRPRRSGPLLAALAALLVLAALAFLLLSGGGSSRTGGSAGKPHKKAKATPTATATATATPRQRSTPTPTPTPSATRSATPSPAASGAAVDLGRAARLQVAGYRARLAGDPRKGLDLSRKALAACGSTHQLDPCGYALFEVGADLNALGRPREAIPFLQRRLSQYGDNPDGAVARELASARAKLSGGTAAPAPTGGGKGKGKGKGKD